MTRTLSAFVSATVSATPSPTWAPAGNVFINRNSMNSSEGQVVTISLYLPNGGETKVTIYNSAGELVKRLAEKDYPPGTVDYFNWDGRNEFGEMAASGIYLIHVNNRFFIHTARIAVLR